MGLEEIQSLEKVSLTRVPPHHRRTEVQASEPGEPPNQSPHRLVSQRTPLTRPGRFVYNAQRNLSSEHLALQALRGLRERAGVLLSELNPRPTIISHFVKLIT